MQIYSDFSHNGVYISYQPIKKLKLRDSAKYISPHRNFYQVSKTLCTSHMSYIPLYTVRIRIAVTVGFLHIPILLIIYTPTKLT